MESSAGDLVRDHLPLVAREAARLRLGRLDRADLHQAGVVGLLVAAARFDPSKGPFDAYAQAWVRKEMQRAIANGEFSAVVPANYVGRVIALRKVSETGEVDEWAHQLGLSRDVVTGLLRLLTVDGPAGEVPDARPVSVEDQAVTRQLGDVLASAMRELAPSDQAVVAASFGLGDHDPRSARAIGRDLGISPTTVRSRLDRALARLRRSLGADEPSGGQPMTTKTLEWPTYGFGLDIPTDWEVFPGQQSGSPEIARITRDAAELGLTLILWKWPNEASEPDFLAGVQASLEARSYADFAIHTTTTTGGLRAQSLTATQPDGWATKQYYLRSGAAIYVLGWGTAELATDRDTIERITTTFRLLDRR